MSDSKPDDVTRLDFSVRDVKRLDFSGRDVTDLPGMWSEDDRTVKRMNTYQLHHGDTVQTLLAKLDRKWMFVATAIEQAGDDPRLAEMAEEVRKDLEQIRLVAGGIKP